MSEEQRINIIEETPAVHPVEVQAAADATPEYASFIERFVALVIAVIALLRG